MAVLRLSLLGGFRAQLASGEGVDLPHKKAQALLAYLGLHLGHPFLRDKLASLLWGDLSDAQARHSLRQTLFTLRKALPPTPPTLLTEGKTVALCADAVEVDVVGFERLALQAEPEAWAQAAALYRGQFLDGFCVNEISFEDWLRVERERLHELMLEILAKLLARQVKDNELEAAIQTGLTLLALDPLQEVTHRALMRLYIRKGRRAAALRQYQVCVDVLKRELGADPEPETRKLFQELLPDHRAAEPNPFSIREMRWKPRAGRRPRGPIAVKAPLIARAVEVDQLRQLLQATREQQGAVVTIVGEAGIGKTRLVAELEAMALQQDFKVLTGRAYETTQVLPFGPWVDAFRPEIVTAPETLRGLGVVWQSELGRLFPELATPVRPFPSGDALRLFEAVTQLADHLAASRPLLLILEDLQRADEMSLRLFAFLGRRLDGWPVLLVATIREEDTPDVPFLGRTLDELRQHSRLVELALSPLSRDDTVDLIRSAAGAGVGTVHREQVENHVWAVSDGNPFIALETLRMLDEEASADDVFNLPLPRSVRELITARLTRLNERTRQLVITASVLGREFDFELVQRAAGLGDRETADGVEELVRRRIFQSVNDRLDFTHHRIREVVLGQLVPTQRRLLHRLVARAIEEVHGDSLEPHYSALADHYRQAEVWDKTVTYLVQAGRTAARRSASRDAVNYFQQALGALAALPESPSKLEQAVDVHLELRPVVSLNGEVRRSLEFLREAESMAEKLNDDLRRGQVAAVLTNTYSDLGDLDEAISSGTHAMKLARRCGDLKLCILAATCLEQVHYQLGEYERVVQLAVENLARLPSAWVYEHMGASAPMGVYNRFPLVLSLAQLGRFEEARQHGAEMARLVETLHHAYTVGSTHYVTGILHIHRGEWAKARLPLENAIAVLRTGDVGIFLPTVIASSAWVLAQLDEAREAASQISETMELLERHAAWGVASHQSVAHYRLGRASLLLGRLVEARRLGDRASEFSVGHRGVAPHALCLSGDIATHPDRFDAERGEAHYRQALALAEPRGMRPLVAHCHLGLGKLYRRTGKCEEAQEHLTTATTMYREMDMRFWLEQAEAQSRELA